MSGVAIGLCLGCAQMTSGEYSVSGLLAFNGLWLLSRSCCLLRCWDALYFGVVDASGAAHYSKNVDGNKVRIFTK